MTEKTLLVNPTPEAAVQDQNRTGLLARALVQDQNRTGLLARALVQDQNRTGLLARALVQDQNRTGLLARALAQDQNRTGLLARALVLGCWRGRWCKSRTGRCWRGAARAEPDRCAGAGGGARAEPDRLAEKDTHGLWRTRRFLCEPWIKGRATGFFCPGLRKKPRYRRSAWGQAAAG